MAYTAFNEEFFFLFLIPMGKMNGKYTSGTNAAEKVSSANALYSDQTNQIHTKEKMFAFCCFTWPVSII